MLSDLIASVQVAKPSDLLAACLAAVVPVFMGYWAIRGIASLARKKLRR